MPLRTKLFAFIITAVLAAVIEFFALTLLFEEETRRSLITSAVSGIGAGIGILLAMRLKKKQQPIKPAA